MHGMHLLPKRGDQPEWHFGQKLLPVISLNSRRVPSSKRFGAETNPVANPPFTALG